MSKVFGNIYPGVNGKSAVLASLAGFLLCPLDFAAQFAPGAIAVAAANGEAYISSPNTGSINVYDSNGTIHLQFGSNGSGAGQFNGPSGVAVLNNGNIAVVDTG